jgi:hypothetical protein
MPAHSADDALERLKGIRREFTAFCEAQGAVSEADTRVKVIDRLLVDVCCWPEGEIIREERVDRGYMDYCLKFLERPFIAVEAKREGIPFVFPVGHSQRRLKLSGSLLSRAEIKDVVNQVRGYCDDEGIRYAIATNGNAWIVFRAIREDMPWREGTARIFPNLDYIIDNFTDFWNLLSYEAILSGSLEAEFGLSKRPTRELVRVVDQLYNADVPLQRNRLHAQLYPLLKAVFEDIADQDALEILQACYVHSVSLKIVADDLNFVITDSIPRFLKHEGAEPVQQGTVDAGRFGTAMAEAVTSSGGQLGTLENKTSPLL